MIRLNLITVAMLSGMIELCATAMASAEVMMASHATQVADARGKKLHFATKPVRIASGSVAGDELLWLILSKAGATDRLVAVSTLSDSPRYSHLKDGSKKIPGRVGGSIEHLLGVQPDLVVLASFNRPELIRKVESLGIPVWILSSFNGLTDISRSISELGKLIHEEKAAARVFSEFQKGLATLKKKPSKRPTVLGINQDKSAWGKGTIFDDLVWLTGGKNCLQGPGMNGWPRLSAEYLATLDPDWIVMSGEERDREHIKNHLKNWPEARAWKALQKGRLILIPSRDLHAASPWILEAGHVLQKHLAMP